MSKPESRLRGLHKAAVLRKYPDAIVVSQPASETTGPGRTDFYAVVYGRYVGLEIKTSTGRATPIQLERIRRIRQAGGWADVVRTPEQSLALIEQALKESGMWNNLFDETEPEPATPDPGAKVDPLAEDLKEIQAFPPISGEPAVEAELRKNGMQPAGDGVSLEPPADYPYAVIIQRLTQTQIMLARVDWLVRALFAVLELEIPTEAAPDLETVGSSEPQSPPTKRSRRKA